MLNAGQVLQGRYRVERLLAQGGMGDLYLATHMKLQKLTVLKTVRPLFENAADQQRFEEAFEREAQILASLDHPNLARVTDFFEEAGTSVLVMEFIEGATLERKVLDAGKGLAEVTVLGWAHQILDALEYLHSHTPAVIVRDLKPSNVMLDLTGRIRLIDFGLAKLLTHGQTTVSILRGAVSDGFAPLEQYGGGATDQRSDLYV